MAVVVNNSNQINFFGVRPTDYIYEDDQCFVFDEFDNPQAPVHYVVVSKTPLPRLCEAKEEDEKIIGHLLLVANDLAVSRGIHNTGYHVMVHEDHRSSRMRGIHVFGRALQHMLWPVGPGARL